MKRLLSIYIFVLFFIGTLSFPAFASADTLVTTVSILPLKYFVDKIGGKRVFVNVMVPKGNDPHNYEPKPRQIRQLADSKLYFSLGIEFERIWLDKFQHVNPKMVIVAVDHGINKHLMNETRSKEEDHSTVHDQHEHHGHDPHIWLSPILAKHMAQNIYQSLLKVDPAGKDVYQSNHRLLLAELDSLLNEINHVFAGQRKGAGFLVFHPSWGYFAQAFGLKQIAVEVEGKSITPVKLHRVIQIAKAEGIKVVFIQPGQSSKVANMITKEIGGRTALIDPLAYDWDVNLRKTANHFKNAMQP